MTAQKGKGAEGSSMLESTTFEEELELERDRLEKLVQKDRQRTMLHMSTFFPEEDADTRPKHGSPPIHQQQQQQQQQAPDLQAAQREGRITFETSNRRIKNFSALSNPANNELDYKHWRRAAMRVLEDADLPEAQKKRILLQSLVGGAEDTIDPHRHLATVEIMDVLDKVYGPTSNGGDMLAEFYQKLQGKDQTAGDYLNQLFVDLSEVVAASGLHMSKLPETLLGQFVRGMHDEDLVNKLRLDEKLDDPPTFPDLLSLVRREESKRTERRLRHRKIVKAQATTVDSNSEFSSFPDLNVPGNQHRNVARPAYQESEVVQMQQRIAQLEQQVSGVTLQKTGGRGKVFCYRCGVDGHVATDCSNRANKDLVKQKVDARRQGHGNSNRGN